MIKPDSKVTSCLIFIQETNNIIKPQSFDAFLRRTSVKKYYIGLGQYFMKYTILNTEMNHENIPYPLLQIDDNGLTALKCPTISGGKWFANFDFPPCHQTNVNDYKGQDINLIRNLKYNTNFFTFWTYLIFVDGLGFNIKFYDPQSNVGGNIIDLKNSYILPLRKHNNNTVVSNYE